jgi:hypothetical protein
MVRNVSGHIDPGASSSKWKWEATLASFRDATSASLLLVPATWNTAGGADRVFRCRMAKPLIKW